MTRPHPLATFGEPRPGRLPGAPEVTNIAVRVGDYSAILGIVTAREKLFDRNIDRIVAGEEAALRLTGEAANCALDALFAIGSPDTPIGECRARLELTAALAIAALVELERAGQ